MYSGGKDSTFVVESLQNSGFEVTCLISIISENPDSYMLHTANIELSKLSAMALGIPIVSGRTKGMKEEELSEIQECIAKARKKFPFEFLGSGAICSEYQRSRLAKIASQIGISSLTPLWGVDQEQYVRDLVQKGYHFIFTSVSAEGLNESWLGKSIDEKAVVNLVSLSRKYHFNPALEGGEGETLVLDCPLFKKSRLEITESTLRWDGSRGILAIKNAKLVNKY